MVLCGDIERALLEIISYRVTDALRYHGLSYFDLSRAQVNNFTRLVFDITKPPFTIEGKLKVHVNNYKSVYPELIKNIRIGNYVNDLVLRKNILSNIEKIKQKSIELFSKGGLHK